MPRTTTLLLARHGHTSGNCSGLDVPMSGWTDLPLSRLGTHQALALAQHLARGAMIAALYTSPLRRARDTAAFIAATTGVPAQAAPGLREIHCGRADGLRLREVQQRYPDVWTRNMQQRDPDLCWPGGETYRAFRDRVLATLRAIAAEHQGERILLVTHAGAISQILGSIAGICPGRWEPFRPHNGSVTEIAWERDQARLVRFDERPAVARPAAAG